MQQNLELRAFRKAISPWQPCDVRSFDSRNQSRDLLDELVTIVSIICGASYFAMEPLFSTIDVCAEVSLM